MNKLKRPVLRWHGGKWRIAPWIIENLPKHRVYVEPFGGAASVLLRKPRAHAEYYSDLDGDVVNLFQVLRSKDAGRLVDMVRLTPFSRVEYEKGHEIVDCSIERARRLIVRSFMGFASSSATKFGTGFRATSERSHSTPARDWMNYPEALSLVVNRLLGVVIECRPALDVIRERDKPDALHYIDPPYIAETRDKGSDYKFELTVEDHLELISCLKDVKGMVVLSGYPSDIYNDNLGGWKRVQRQALADGARKRTEVLWLNPACEHALKCPDLLGFAS